MSTATLAPEDFDLDLQVEAPVHEDELLVNKSGVTDICTTIFWPCS